MAGSDDHPSHTSSMAPNHKRRSDHSVCQRKGWDKFTQEISNTNNHNQCLFSLLLMLKHQETLPQEDFPPSVPQVQTFSPYACNYEIILSNKKHNTLRRKENKLGPASTFIYSPHALTFLCNWNRDAPFSFLYAKLVSCHVIRAHKSLTSSKEGSQAPAPSCIELAQTCIFQALPSPTAQRTLQHHPDRALV